MTAHAKLSPSSSSRWLKCTAAPDMEFAYESKTSDYAQEGIEAHDLLERAVKSKTRPSDLEPEHHAAKDVDLAFDYVSERLSDPSWIVFSETQVKLTEDCWGTADLILFKGGYLEVVDYKHGKGIVVEVPCDQLNIYGAAAIRSMSFLLDEPIQFIKTTVVQPRAEHPEGPIRHITKNVDDLMDEIKDIETVIEFIKEGKTCYAPGDDTCRFCRASGNCSAQAEAALMKAHSYFTPTGMVATPNKDKAQVLSNEEKLAIIESAKFITTFLTAIEVSIRDALLAGEEIPGAKVVAGRSIRKWGLDEEEIIKTLKEDCKLKLSEFAPPKLLGPASVEKLIDVKKRGGKKKMEALQSLIVKPEGKPIVVSDTDPRPSIAPHFKPLN